jgi:predicted site-specific integrase-resolvase
MSNTAQLSAPVDSLSGRHFASEKKAAEFFDVTERTIRRWAAEGIIPPPVKIGGARRYLVDDLRKVGTTA